MQLQDLSLFVRVAQAGSLSAAARQLDLTPAAVSAAVKRLEARLGVRLVERTTRSLRMTAEGAQFVKLCEDMLATWGRGRAGLAVGTRQVEGRVHVAAPADTSLQFLAPWMGDLLRTHPGLQVVMHVGDHVHDVSREGVDLAIRYGPLEDSGLTARTLCVSPRVAVASPGYIARAGRPKTPQDLADHACLAWLSKDQPRVTWQFGAGVLARSVSVRPTLCGDGAVVRAWALAGDGIAYKALADVVSDLERGSLVEVLPEARGEAIPISAVLPSGKYLPQRVRVLLDELSGRFAALQLRVNRMS